MIKKICLLLFFITASQLIAQTDSTAISTDRPTQTASAYTIPKGSVQIETGFAISRTDLGFNNFEKVIFSQIAINSTQVRVGVSNNLELLFSQSLLKSRIRGGGVDDDSMAELLPTLFGARIGIADANSNGGPQIAVLATVGGGLFSEVETGTIYDVRLNFQHSFEGGFGLGYNVAGIYNDQLDQFDGLLTVVASYQANEKISVFGELFSTFPSLNDAVLQADLGVLYLVNPNLQIDIFGGLGISEQAPDTMFGLGLSVKIPKR